MKKQAFRMFDRVELIAEDEKYFGMHKGAKGNIVEFYGDLAAEVDFDGIDENGNHYWSYFAVDLKDLKRIDPDA